MYNEETKVKGNIYWNGEEVKPTPYKLKCELQYVPNYKERRTEVKALFVCDPKKNKECKKTACGKECTQTTDIRFAKHFNLFE